MLRTGPGACALESPYFLDRGAGYSSVTLGAMARRWRYSRWDGSQAGFDLDAEGVLGEIADDLLYHGDLNAALRRALQSGMRAPDGRQLEGLRQLLERIARRRREELERHELSGLGEDIARRLDEVMDLERHALDRGDVPHDEAQARHQRLDEMPPDLAGRFRQLRQYGVAGHPARPRLRQPPAGRLPRSGVGPGLRLRRHRPAQPGRRPWPARAPR